jgi:tetratricopeptide (TPR) repeat protein
LNHLIESSILPLELVFEHRNYLPSLFLFLPIAAVIKKIFDYYQGRSRIIYQVLAVLTASLIMGLGISTYIRNSVWASEKSLWEDVKLKSPGMAGPYQILAGHHKEKGQYEIALQLYQKALNLSSQMPKRSQALCLNNMGNIFLNMGEYEQAINHFKRALAVYPGYERSLHNITLAFIKSQKLETAREYADLLNSRYYHEKYLNLKAFILIKQGRPDDAIPYLANALQISPFNRNATVNLAAAFTLTGKYEEAETLLRKINRTYPKDITALLYLIENSSRAGNDVNTDMYVEKLFADFSVDDIRASLAKYSVNNAENLYPVVLLAQTVAEKFHQKALALNVTTGKNE